MSILAEIGQQLKDARTARNRSVEDLARETHLKPAHIQAIEAGDEAALPEPVYVKSFIRKYAMAVGLPGDELASRYWVTRPLPTLPQESRPEFSAPWWILPAVLLVLMLGGLVYAYRVSTAPPAPSPTPTVAATPTMAPTVSPATTSSSPSIPAATTSATASVPELAPVATPVVTPTPVLTPSPRPTLRPTPKPTPKPTPIPTVKPSSPDVTPSVGTVSVLPGLGPVKPVVVLKLHAVQRSWVLVRRQGQDLYSGILPTGQTRSWTVTDPLAVTIGNAAGVQVSVGDKSLGVLGSEGQVVKRVFKREEY